MVMRKIFLLILSLAGLFDATYLLWVYTSPSHPLVCLGTGCDVVRASRYASFWGRPMPVYGVVAYLVLVLIVLTQAWLVSPSARRLAQKATAAITAGGVAFSLYLTYLEGFVIHAWCAWCLGSAIIMGVLFLLALSDLASTPGARDSTETEHYRVVLRKRFVLVALVMVAGEALAYRYLTSRPEVPFIPTASEQILNEHLVEADSHATGNSSAPVTVVEFGDFECPACGATQPAVQEMLDKYGSRIRFVFRQYPLVEIHPYAETAAEASECAAHQGKFWEAERKFYQSQDDLTEPALVRYAKDIGLDVNRFQQCLIDGTVKARIQRDLQDGKLVGVQGTPTFFVGHEKHLGPMQSAQLDGMVDAALLAVGPTPHPGSGQAFAASGSTSGSTSGGAQSASAANTSSAGSSSGSTPGNPAADSGGSLFGSNSTNVFTSVTSKELACDPDELKRQQPALVHTPELQQLYQSASKPVFIDVRPASQVPSGHLPGALSIPVDKIEDHASSLPKDKTIVLYESGKSKASSGDVCAVSRAGARILLAEHFDYAKVKVYQDGLAGWEQAGLPVEK